MHGFVEVYCGSVATVHGRKLKWERPCVKELKGVCFEARIDMNNQTLGGDSTNQTFWDSSIFGWSKLLWKIIDFFVCHQPCSGHRSTQLAFSSRNESPVGALELWTNPCWVKMSCQKFGLRVGTGGGFPKKSNQFWRQSLANHEGWRWNEPVSWGSQDLQQDLSRSFWQAVLRGLA